MRFRLQQKLMTLNDLKGQFTAMSYAYIDQTAKARIMQFSLKCSTRPYLFACQVQLRNSKGLLDRGLKLGWVVSDFAMVYLGNGAR